VWGDQRAAAVNHFLSVCFERIGRVVVAGMEQKLQKPICQPVDKILQLRIVNRSSSLDETASENTIDPLVQFFPVHDDIATIIGLIRHHNNHRVTLHAVEPLDDRSAEAVRSVVLDGN
jgi:hypothetical protein